MVYFKEMSRFLALITAYCLLFGVSFAEVVPGHIIVKFKPGIVKIPRGMAVASVKAASISAASVNALAVKYGVVQFKQIYQKALEIRPDWKHLQDDYVLIFPKDKDVYAAFEDFKKDANVVAASPDPVVRAFSTTPNDPYFSQQWSLNKISAPQAWDRTTGSTETEIAVLDTGVNYNHEDFAGKVDLAHAWDYVNDDNDPLDDFGHGTAVSGVIGAVTDNNKGIAGIEWKAKILPIKVLDYLGRGDAANISAALAYVTALRSTWEVSGGTSGANIVVVNMSLGQYNDNVKYLHNGVYEYQEQDPANLKERCQEAHDQGIVLVAAAGNGDVDWNTYPAYYSNYSTVIAVAATDSSDLRSEWTNTDPDTGRIQKSNYASWVDVAAPGTAIFSTDRGGSYTGGWSGTSLACPHVTGLAGLVKASNPSVTNTQITSQIKSSTDFIDDLNPGFAGKLGTGRINAYRALAGFLIGITDPASGEYIKGVKQVRGTAAGWNFSSYEVEALRNGSVEVKVYSSFSSVEGGVLVNWDTTGLNGAYTLRLRIVMKDFSSAETSVNVFIDNTTPEVAITSPANGATVAGRFSILGKATDQYLDRYVLEYGAGTSPATYQTIGTFYASVESGVLGTWETAGLNGTYTLRLTAYDLAGTLSSTSNTVEITAESPTKEVIAQAGLPLTFVLPNPFNRDLKSSTGTTETYFTYSLSGNFNVTIYLFDLNGNLIWRKTFLAGENGGKAGPNNPSWNGVNLFGESVPNGVYLYQVATDQRVIARGKIIVLN